MNNKQKEQKMKTSTKNYLSDVVTYMDGSDRYAQYKQTFTAMASQTGSNIRDWYASYGIVTIADLDDLASTLYNMLSPNAKAAEAKICETV
jgi:hypothetical protein